MTSTIKIIFGLSVYWTDEKSDTTNSCNIDNSIQNGNITKCAHQKVEKRIFHKFTRTSYSYDIHRIYVIKPAMKFY